MLFVLKVNALYGTPQLMCNGTIDWNRICLLSLGRKVASYWTEIIYFHKCSLKWIILSVTFCFENIHSSHVCDIFLRILQIHNALYVWQCFNYFFSQSVNLLLWQSMGRDHWRPFPLHQIEAANISTKSRWSFDDPATEDDVDDQRISAVASLRGRGWTHVLVSIP